MSKQQHWDIVVDADRVWWLFFDKYGEKVNTLDRAALEELEEIIETIARDKSVKGVVIGSRKTSGFIAGADVKQFQQFTSVEQGQELLTYGQSVFSKIESLGVPTCAMIHGFCLGGGLELALACHARVALDDATLGLPEVMLGIHPGWGGTVRLPALIGGGNALSTILTGKTLPAKKAKALGVVDVVVPRRYLEKAAKHAVMQPIKRRPSWRVRLSNMHCARRLIAHSAKKQLSQKVSAAHYPAPFAAIAQWKKYGVGSHAMAAEAASVASLFTTPTCRELVRLFFLREQLKASAKQTPSTIQHVHVIGAGTMGGDIAAWCAHKGLRVTLQDQTPERIAPAMARAYATFSAVLRSPRAIQAAMDRLIPDVRGHGIASADVIIEAVFEDVAVKHAVFAELDARAKPAAIFATNTSSIPLETIATCLSDPSRLVGIHFFNPVAKMPLIEVVAGHATNTDIVARAMAFVGQLDKLPLLVQSSPGFLVNRVLMPYLMQAVLLHEEGVPLAVIDQIAVNFGMPMGPVALADTVGLDVCLHVARHLGCSIPSVLESKVTHGQLGVKSGEGFYRYKKGRAIKRRAPASAATHYPDVESRLILSMVNEAAACLREGVVDNANDLDAGMVFGTGFAPYTGGPMQYAAQCGVDVIVARLHELQQAYGDVFAPDAWWASASL